MQLIHRLYPKLNQSFCSLDSFNVIILSFVKNYLYILYKQNSLSYNPRVGTQLRWNQCSITCGVELTLGVVCLDKDVMLAVNISHVSHYFLENLVRTICSYKVCQFCVALFFFLKGISM